MPEVLELRFRGDRGEVDGSAGKGGDDASFSSKRVVRVKMDVLVSVCGFTIDRGLDSIVRGAGDKNIQKREF